MNKREIMLYAITIISFIAFISIIFGVNFKSLNISDNKPISMTGNAVLDLNDSFKIGDKLTGEIVLNSDERKAYGVLLLTKNSKPLMTETFNLEKVFRERKDGVSIVKFEDIMDYTFEEKGNYELFFSVLDLEISIKKEFAVK